MAKTRTENLAGSGLFLLVGLVVANWGVISALARDGVTERAETVRPAQRPAKERLHFPGVSGLPNLGRLKEKLIAYHDCTCDCGCYADDLARVGNRALAFLRNYLSAKEWREAKSGKGPAIVIDVDETAISNWENMRKQDFGYSHDIFVKWEAEAKAPAIEPVLALFNFARQNQVATFFVTSRPEEERSLTERDLETAGYKGWTVLIMKQPDSPRLAADFKSQQRKKLRQAGYVLVVNIGDQASDLVGEPALRAFKLPNPFYYLR